MRDISAALAIAVGFANESVDMTTPLLYIASLPKNPVRCPMMNDTDYTLTSPISSEAQVGRRLLGLTIAWHPERQRIGEQYICTNTNDALGLSRYLPTFQKPGGERLGLGYSGVSREPLAIARDADDGVTIRPPNSRMVVEVNGVEINGEVHLSSAQIETGAVLGLGRAVLLCLHWMRCLPKLNPVDGLIGVGEVAIKTRDLIRQAARTDATVLLLGETGTGKEVTARGIHALSQRAALPLVCVNMAALNESLAAADLFGAAKGAYTGAASTRTGLFGQAQGATLFLDEIGNTPTPVQPMLLRVLETGDYRPLGAERDLRSTARLIAATDQDLYGGGFNQALLRRLESFTIHIAPLRARREDIGLLLAHLLLNSKLEGVNEIVLPIGLISRFLNYDWPGNIRQLTHVLKRSLLALQQGDMPGFDSLVEITPERITASATARAVVAAATMPAVSESAPAASTLASALASAPAPTSALPEAVPAGRKKLTDINEQDILAAMQANDWQIQGAAQALGVSRPSMYKLLETHSQIRRAEQIPREEIVQTLEQCSGDVEACAAQLKTPGEALRRYLRMLGLTS